MCHTLIGVRWRPMKGDPEIEPQLLPTGIPQIERDKVHPLSFQNALELIQKQLVRGYPAGLVHASRLVVIFARVEAAGVSDCRHRCDSGRGFAACFISRKMGGRFDKDRE